jgi:hypothetical protein
MLDDDNSFFASSTFTLSYKSFKNKNSDLTVITFEQIRIVNDSQETPGRLKYCTCEHGLF